MTPVEEICAFNKNAGLLTGYDDYLESSMLVEEAIEGLIPNAKQQARELVLSFAPLPPVPDVDRLDKACDAVVIAVGSMAKLGLTPDQITRALHIVNAANNTKLGCHRDQFGKLVKPVDFVGPEKELQVILDERDIP